MSLETPAGTLIMGVRVPELTPSKTEMAQPSQSSDKNSRFWESAWSNIPGKADGNSELNAGDNLRAVCERFRPRKSIKLSRKVLPRRRLRTRQGSRNNLSSNIGCQLPYVLTLPHATCILIYCAPPYPLPTPPPNRRGGEGGRVDKN